MNRRQRHGRPPAYRAVACAFAVLALIATGCSGGGGVGTPSAPKTGSITGIVTLERIDAQPGDPSGMVVQVDGHPTWRATPTSSGAYQLSGIPEGVYSMVLVLPEPPPESLYVAQPARREAVKVYGGLPTVGVDFQVETLPAPPSF